MKTRQEIDTATVTTKIISEDVDAKVFVAEGQAYLQSRGITLRALSQASSRHDAHVAAFSAALLLIEFDEYRY